MRGITKKIITILASIIILISCLLLIILPKKEFSENENRYLQSFPQIDINSIISGQAMEKIELYINNHFPFRDKLIGVKSQIERLLGKSISNGIYIGQNGFLLKRYDGYDINVMNEQTEKINNFCRSLEVNAMFLLAPTSTEIYSKMRPKFADDSSQVEDIVSFYSKLEGIIAIDAYKNLIMTSDEEQLYFKQDHHWNTNGAYQAYQAFCDSKDILYHTKDEFKLKRISGDFYGSYYSQSGFYGFSADYIDVYLPLFDTAYSVNYFEMEVISDSLYNYENLLEKDKYTFFMDNNQPLIIIENNLAENDTSIAIIKDSYANSFIPFLVPHYSKIYVIDMRYFMKAPSEYIKLNHIDEILFLYNIDTLRSDKGIYKLR